MLHDGIKPIQENLMLKEVGRSGQISLGKRFAGQLFDVQFLDTGVVQMSPVRIVPAVSPVSQERPPSIANPTQDDGWHLTHAQHIAEYNAWAEQRLSFSESVREWRENQQSQPLAG